MHIYIYICIYTVEKRKTVEKCGGSSFNIVNVQDGARMSTTAAVSMGGNVHYGGWMEVTALGKKLFLSLLVA